MLCRPHSWRRPNAGLPDCEVTPQQAALSQRRMRSLMGKAGERSPPPLHRRPGTSSMTRGRGLNGWSLQCWARWKDGINYYLVVLIRDWAWCRCKLKISQSALCSFPIPKVSQWPKNNLDRTKNRNWGLFPFHPIIKLATLANRPITTWTELGPILFVQWSRQAQKWSVGCCIYTETVP